MLNSEHFTPTTAPSDAAHFLFTQNAKTLRSTWEQEIENAQASSEFLLETYRQLRQFATLPAVKFAQADNVFRVAFRGMTELMRAPFEQYQETIEATQTILQSMDTQDELSIATTQVSIERLRASGREITSRFYPLHQQAMEGLYQAFPISIY